MWFGCLRCGLTASIVTGLADGYATQMRADAQHDEPLSWMIAGERGRSMG